MLTHPAVRVRRLTADVHGEGAEPTNADFLADLKAHPSVVELEIWTDLRDVAKLDALVDIVVANRLEHLHMVECDLNTLSMPPLAPSPCQQPARTRHFCDGL